MLHDTTLFGLRDEKKSITLGSKNFWVSKLMTRMGRVVAVAQVDPAASEPNAVSKYRNMTILSIIYDPLRTFTTLFPYMVKYVLIVLYRRRRQTRFFRTILST